MFNEAWCLLREYELGKNNQEGNNLSPIESYQVFKDIKLTELFGFLLYLCHQFFPSANYPELL
jgi:hypothetical protein